MINSEILEANIIGAIFWEPEIFPHYRDVLSKDTFRQPHHKNIYGMMVKLDQMGHDINIVNVVTHFEKYLETVGGLEYLSNIGNSVCSSYNIGKYIEQLFEMNARSKLISLLEETKQILSDPTAGEFEQLLDVFEQKALEIKPKSLEKSSRVDGIIDWYEELMLKMADRTIAYGMKTGYEGLDLLTLGFQRSDFFALGARTSMGKSAFANELANRVSERGYKVAMFSLEMNKSQIYNRFTASIARIPLQDLRIGKIPPDKLDAINGVIERVRTIHIDDTRGVTAEYITGEMRRLKRQEGLDFVIIDYLQELVEKSEKNDHTGSALHRVCQKIRTAAKECDCFVLGLSQLKQEIDVRQNKRPMISDLSGSAAIAAVADGIILLYRDEYYNPDTKDQGILEVNLAKQRNGPTGLVKLKYDKIYQNITTSYF
jgi:replicative DNA helicase